MSTKKLVTAAVFIALSTGLNLVSFQLPYGGSITLASMVPIIWLSYKYGPKFGALCGFVYSLAQIAVAPSGAIAPPTGTLLAYSGVFLMDYILPFTVLGIAGIWKNPAIGATIVCVLRFVCHFISGVIIWGVYAPEGQAVPIYSLIYNGSYMLPETIITAIAIVIIWKTLPAEKR